MPTQNLSDTRGLRITGGVTSGWTATSNGGQYQYYPPGMTPTGIIITPTTTSDWVDASDGGHYQYAASNSYQFFRLTIQSANSGNVYLGQLALYNGVTQFSPINLTDDFHPIPYSVEYSACYNDGSNWVPHKMFDAYQGTSPSGNMGWNLQSGQLPGWIQIKLEKPYVLTKYRLYSTSHNVCPRSWKLEGSMYRTFGGEQTLLHSGIGVDNWGADAYVEYTL